MFAAARLRLTAWYLFIIMGISIFFSIVIFKGATAEVERGIRAQELRTYRQRFEEGLIPFIPDPQNISIDPQILQEGSQRILFILVLVNLGILVFAGGAGYFLAGQTLKPIAEMVTEQNRFITDASHEIRTPLTSLRSEIEVYLREKTHTLEEAAKLLQSNLEEVQSLQLLSDNLLELTQYNRQGENAHLEKLSLTTVVKNAEKKVLSLANKKHITIKNTVKNQSILGNGQSLIQLFVILLDNAIKYSPVGKKVAITSKKTDHSVKIAVIDEGIGISQKDIVRIFDRFFRADVSRTKNTVSGYGLGLSIAQKIANQHKGTLSVKSTLHKGATFTLSLPAI